MSAPKFRGLTEYQECSDFARYLDRRGFLYTHVPLGGARDPKEAARLKAIGTKRGVPDFLIFDAGPRGVAVEMKRERGGTVSLQQKAWIEALSEIGWNAFVARGAREAIERMEKLDPRE
jgi:hypothetical protein